MAASRGRHGKSRGRRRVCRCGSVLFVVGPLVAGMIAVAASKVAMRCAHWRLEGEFEGGYVVKGGYALRALAH